MAPDRVLPSKVNKLQMAFRYFVPALIWGILILFAVSMPPDRIPALKFFIIPHFDKLVHIGMFLVFAFLACFGFYSQNKNGIMHRKYLSLALLVSLLISLFSELLQHFFLIFRIASFFDFIANLIGTIFGVVLFGILLKIKPKFFRV